MICCHWVMCNCERITDVLAGYQCLSDLIRNPHTSIVVAAELRYGAIKSNSEKLAERIDIILSALEILPLETPADRQYAVIRHHLARQGIPIGPNDLLIAAHALSNNLTVVTTNVRGFSRVPGVKVENWLWI